MKLNRQISLFLILVLSIQVLPLQRIAAWLSSGQITEEIAHSPEPPSKAKSPLPVSDPAFLLHSYYGVHLLSLEFCLKKYHFDEILYIRVFEEIFVPPPNA